MVCNNRMDDVRSRPSATNRRQWSQASIRQRERCMSTARPNWSSATRRVAVNMDHKCHVRRSVRARRLANEARSSMPWRRNSGPSARRHSARPCRSCAARMRDKMDLIARITGGSSERAAVAARLSNMSRPTKWFTTRRLTAMNKAPANRSCTNS